MNRPRENQAASNNVMDLLSQASSGNVPTVPRMPRPSIRCHVAMRDGIGLDTWVWLPFDRPGPFPTVLLRTPYQDSLMGWSRGHTLRYRDAGYAVVHQLIRGIAGSGGRFSFNNPQDGEDGHDTIAWIAAQAWSDGQVGMEGSSYAGMTQLTAAATQPPALKCIVPTVVSASFFDHIPRIGGVFSRQHSLGWTQFTVAETLAELTPGLWGDAALLASPAAWRRLLHRPAIEASEGVLSEDRAQHYRDVLRHARFDDFWHERTLGPGHCARINVPTLVVSGVFDGTMGSQHLWQQLEWHAPAGVERHFVIGPWDHGQAYVGSNGRLGPLDFGEAGRFDILAARMAFFDKHLKGIGNGPALSGRVTLFITGANRWECADRYPHPQVVQTPLYLHSDGLANLRGHGRLEWAPPAGEQSPDSFQADPRLPFVAVGPALDPQLMFDVREMERQEDVLVYTSAPLDRPLTLLGQFTAELHLAADTPDCDIACVLAEVPAGGIPRAVSKGVLRLRYREGYEREVLLTPGQPVLATVAMNHIAHEFAAGSRLRLLIGLPPFPIFDPNPNTGEAIADATELRTAVETIFHDAVRASRLLLPVLGR